MSCSTSNQAVILNLFQDLPRSDALYGNGILKRVQDDECRENVAA